MDCFHRTLRNDQKWLSRHNIPLNLGGSSLVNLAKFLGLTERRPAQFGKLFKLPHLPKPEQLGLCLLLFLQETVLRALSSPRQPTKGSI
jgi:hypothetical protein